MPTPAKRKKLLIGCSVSAIIISVAVVLLLIFGMRAFINFGIASDISEYIELIKKSDSPNTHKQQLITKLTKLRTQARAGNHVDVNSWIESDEIIRKLLIDNTITDIEFNKINKEINYLQRELIIDNAEEGKQ